MTDDPLLKACQIAFDHCDIKASPRDNSFYETQSIVGLVDGNGEIIFLNGQAEVYENQREAISANKDQGDEYTVVACTLM